MRMMLKAVLDTEAVNEATRAGSVQDLSKQLVEMLQPEAVYFTLDEGRRTTFAVFDLADPSQLPVICEPLFLGARATITIVPCLTLDDLQQGLADAVARAGTPG